MGKAPSKSTIIKISSHLNEKIKCPICDKEFTSKQTFKDLNEHLKKCGLTKSEFQTPRNKMSKRDSMVALNQKLSSKELDVGKFSSSLEEKYLNFTKFIEKSILKVKNEEMCSLIADSMDDLFDKIKNHNIYVNSQININKLNLNFTLSNVPNYYFDFMIDKKFFYIINGKTISFDLLNENVDWFLFGVIIAITLIYINTRIKYKINSFLCSLILNKNIQLHELQYFNSEFYDELNKISKEENILNLNLFFIIDNYELIENGKETQVNEYNLNDYINKRINYEMSKYIQKINLIREGIFKYIPKEQIYSFSCENFYQLINRMI